jgi:hypothetical protein
MYLQEMRCEVVKWIDLAQEEGDVAGGCKQRLNICIPYQEGNFFSR